jgi:dihydrodipicolinate synthase/N-acetylneuraminate lyase
MRFEPGRFAGIWVPIVTPFRDEEPDLDTLARLVDWLLARGVEGLVALGSTGEGPHLSEAEAGRVVSCVVQAARGRVPVMAGAGRESTRETLRALAGLASLGADAALVLTPFYYRAQRQPAALGGYYAELASASPLPIFVYHIPQVTGIELESGLLADILAHPNVWGFKDSSSRGGPLAETLGRCSTQGFAGSGARLVEALEAGACGGILAAAHVLPEICVQVASALRSGRRLEALPLQAHLTALTEAFRGGIVAGVKCALGLRGIPAGRPRAPLEPAPRAVEEHIAAVLREALGTNGCTAP